MQTTHRSQQGRSDGNHAVRRVHHKLDASQRAKLAPQPVKVMRVDGLTGHARMS